MMFEELGPRQFCKCMDNTNLAVILGLLNSKTLYTDTIAYSSIIFSDM